MSGAITIEASNLRTLRLERFSRIGGSVDVSRSDDRIATLEADLAAGEPDLVDPLGLLAESVRSTLVEGLSLSEFSDELIARLDPSDEIRFSVELVDGRVEYGSAALLTDLLKNELTSVFFQTMNYPTAYQYFEEGVPIARASWAGEFDEAPSRWLTRSGGIDRDNRPEGSFLFEQGENETLTRADQLAGDWIIPAGCSLDLPERPDFPTYGTDDGDPPLIDVFNPPCNVKRAA